MTRIWPFVLTVGFGIVFMGLADLAWLTAIGANSPVYTSSTSAQMYTATLTTATIATLILASFATSRLGHLELRLPEEGAQESEAPHAEAEPANDLANPVFMPKGGSQDPDGLDQILAEIGRYAEGPVVEVREKPAVRLTPAPLSTASVAPTSTRPERARGSQSRASVRRARRLVWQTVAGPLAMFLVFIAISGAMLPATGGFTQTHPQLNTGLILFLGYGWPFLVAWAVSSIAVLHLAVRLESKEPPEREPQVHPGRQG
jgi:hypothetical protein